jgi:hypothetical protein
MSGGTKVQRLPPVVFPYRQATPFYKYQPVRTVRADLHTPRRAETVVYYWPAPLTVAAQLPRALGPFYWPSFWFLLPVWPVPPLPTASAA